MWFCWQFALKGRGFQPRRTGHSPGIVITKERRDRAELRDLLFDRHFAGNETADSSMAKAIS
jgi:hypothetical protein